MADQSIQNLVRSLADGSSTARTQLEQRYRELRSSESPDSHVLIDELAAVAKQSASAMEALLGLVQQHGLAIPAIRQVLIDRSDVEDTEQAVLATVALRLDQFDGRSRFTTWLYRVASNEAKSLIRMRSRRPATGAELPDLGYLARLSTILGQRDLIDRALGELPEKYRVVLLAREVQQLDYEEIASTLDLPLGTVRSRLHRARELMATAISSLQSSG